ncbi:MAG: large-conductance mechanosensitive channel protein MscL [Anaerolineae bacterium]|jgi:large conductance mechanosensitive channel|nr:large-conductance mechanosensitive channel protein MscL [Anaerolineae bacterium]
MIKEFRDFIMRGNVIDLAVGIIMGAAFTSVVNSLVKDVIMPPIGMALGGVDFSDIAIQLKAAETAADGTIIVPAVTIGVGLFINALITFLITAFAVFLLVKAVNEASRRARKPVEAAPAAPAGPTTDEQILTTLKSLNDTLGKMDKKL